MTQAPVACSSLTPAEYGLVCTLFIWITLYYYVVLLGHFVVATDEVPRVCLCLLAAY